MEIKTQSLHPDAILPVRATDGAACFDLHALIEPEAHKIEPRRRFVNAGGKLVVRTGLAFEIPPGHCMLIFSRSGHGFKNDVRLSNSVGVIDADYRGEVQIALRNDGAEAMSVRHGDRIAQAMILPVPGAVFVRTDELSQTERGTGGLGSTGVA